MNVFVRKELSTSLWRITGSFGELKEKIKEKDNIYTASGEKISVVSEIAKDENSVCVRSGRIKNISAEPVTLHTMSSRFSLDGGEYEVYTQYNGWQNESVGGWQPLITSVCARSESLRNTNSANPFAVLWSNQANRGVAFHMNAFSSWEMRITRAYLGGEAAYIDVEMGIISGGLGIELAPGEEYELPEIIYYTVRNKTDMDCWKLHAYINSAYPVRKMPVIYNTWLYKFDRFTYDDILKQIEKAADIGTEYFVIDAGWFGKGEDWWPCRGDWEENLTFGFRGRMSEIADRVRAAGMKFGFWLEPECASADSEIVKAHPEYFLENETMFIDFSNDEALEYIFAKTCELRDRYGAEFFKFDFNSDLYFDRENSGFTKYFDGYVKYISMLKEKYPDLYIEDCASGGLRLSLRDGRLFDSFWFTDNQSPYHGLRIVKDTILRMPPSWLERWISIRSVKAVSPVYAENRYADKIFACNDASWKDIAGVHDSFLKGFLTGGPVGLSFDLTSLTDEAFAMLKKFIAEFKNKRDFWRGAVCHILTDTESMLVFEYRNTDFSDIKLIVFTKKAMQNNIRVYPLVDRNCKYKLPDGSVAVGKQIEDEGIDFLVNDCYSAQFADIHRVD